MIFERQGLVFFVEQHDFDDPGIDDLINEEPSPISGTRRANTRSNITVLYIEILMQR